MEIPVTLLLTKAGPQENGGGSGFGILTELAMDYYFVANGYNTSYKYFDRYCSGAGGTYRLNNAEWAAAANYARGAMSQSYMNGTAFSYNGSTYYSTQVSFYGAGGDLRYAYGTATVTFDSSGEPVGMQDTYDFNAGSRSALNELVTGIGGFAGGNGNSFEIKSGLILVK